jgi:hypothetical protein
MLNNQESEGATARRRNGKWGARRTQTRGAQQAKSPVLLKWPTQRKRMLTTSFPPSHQPTYWVLPIQNMSGSHGSPCTNVCTSQAVIMILQTGLFLRDFFFRDFALTQLENLCHFSYIHNNVWVNAFWHRQYAIIFGLTWCGVHDPWSLALCWRPAKCDITVTPSVMHMDWLC